MSWKCTSAIAHFADVEADNFSDVVPISANVSGRGSPSLSGERMSGRDTPFSANAAEQNGM